MYPSQGVPKVKIVAPMVYMCPSLQCNSSQMSEEDNCIVKV